MTRATDTKEESGRGRIPDADLAALIAATRVDVYSLKSAGKHARYAAEDITDVMESLPDSAPLFALADLVTAKAHALTAARLLDRATHQLTDDTAGGAQ